MGEVTHVALQHRPVIDVEAPSGAGRGDGPVLVVDTRFGERPAPDDAPYRAIVHLEPDGSPDRPDDDEMPDEAIARHRARWQAWTFTVDGHDQVFWFQEVGERWAAFARVGDVRLVVAATRWDRAGVRLAVADRAAYANSESTTSR